MAARRTSSVGPQRSPVIDAAMVDVSVRPARLDRPLRRTALDPTYSDPHLEELVRLAADQAREEARAQGYAAGWSQGRQAAAAKALAESEATLEHHGAERAVAVTRITRLLSSLAEASHAARVAAAPEWIEVADVLADGSLQLAAAALGRELQSVDGAIAHAIKTALRKLAEPGEAVIHLHPADAALLKDDATIGVTVVADPGVSSGSVLMLTPSQRLRYDLPAALAAAEAVLRS
jgi:flagellar assembly protein FliH